MIRVVTRHDRGLCLDIDGTPTDVIVIPVTSAPSNLWALEKTLDALESLIANQPQEATR